MHRLFVSACCICGDKINVSDRSQLKHFKSALRLKKGEKLTVFDDKGREFNCTVESVTKELVLKIESRISVPKRLVPKVTLACAIPKKSKIDDIIDKLTQLGVDRIIPLMTERVVVRFDKDKKSMRKERWQRIAQSAAQQSGRRQLPVVEPIMSMDEVLAEAENFDLKLIPTLCGERKTIKEMLAGAKARNILVFIGPEGDFSDEEVDLALKAGCIAITLGDNVLRVETAAVAVASFIKLYENS